MAKKDKNQSISDLNGTATPVSEATDAPQTTTNNITPELAEKLAQVRQHIQAAFGQTVLAMSALPRYKHMTLTDLGPLVLEPLAQDRIAIAMSSKVEAANETAGIAIWASVSAEVDAKIRDQVKAGNFPVRLAPQDWNSGDQVWLFDVIAPSRKLASAVLTSFRQIAGERDVRLHPLVTRLIEPELLAKLKTASVDQATEQAA